MAPRRCSPKFLSSSLCWQGAKRRGKVEKRKFEQTGKREREKGTLHALPDYVKRSLSSYPLHAHIKEDHIQQIKHFQKTTVRINNGIFFVKGIANRIATVPERNQRR